MDSASSGPGAAGTEAAGAAGPRVGVAPGTAPTPPLGSVEVRGLWKRFDHHVAVAGIDLSVPHGCFYGLVGPNGAGKTTLITLLEGLRQPSSGTVELFGGSPRDYRNRQGLGSTPQETALPATLRVGEVIDFVGRHFEKPLPVGAVAEEFGLTELLKRQTGALSGGQKRRLSVALAFVGQPKLVLLDEPTTGLDVDARRTLWDALRRQHDRGATVVVTSHYLEEIEALAQRVVVMGHGRVIADDTLPAILAQVGLRQVRLTSPDVDRIAQLPGVVRHERADDGTTTFYAQNSDRLIVDLVQSGIRFTGLAVRGATLEEAFLTLTGAKRADAEPGDARPGDATPAGAERADTERADVKPGDARPGDARPGDATPADTERADAKPGDARPGDATPAGARPAEGTPAEGTPAEGTPAEGTPADATPGDNTAADAQAEGTNLMSTVKETNR